MSAESAFWPELIVQELRHITRTNKFNFDLTARDLNEWWNSPRADITAADRGVDIDSVRAFMKTSGIEITAESCRYSFARDYSNAPYKNSGGSGGNPGAAAPVPKVLKENEPNIIVEVLDADEDTASGFENLDEIEPKVVIAAASADSGPSETYEQMMARLEAQQRENFKRKEKVFANVARILHTYTDENGEELTEEDSMKAGRALANSMGVGSALTTPVDQEVTRAYHDGIKQRIDRKKGREELARELAEKRELERQREALRKRFQPDSEDAQGDVFEFQSTSFTDENTASIRTGSGISISNDKVMERLRQTAAEEVEPASLRSRGKFSAPPDLTFGFINTDEFDELLTTLEMEQNMNAGPKGDEDEGESDLAEVLRMLDEAAANNSHAGEYDAAPHVLQLEAESTPKVMLKAGMGILDDPRAFAGSADSKPNIPVATKHSLPIPKPRAESSAASAPARRVDRPQVGKNDASQPKGARGRMTVRAEDDADSGDDSQEDDDDAWKYRRKAIKSVAEERKPDVVSISDSGVYGFGGYKTSPINTKSARYIPEKVQITLERASDRASIVSPSTEEKRVTKVASEAAEEPESPGVASTWIDVQSPKSVVSTEVSGPVTPPPAPLLSIPSMAADQEPAAPLLPMPPKAESSGLLSGSTVRTRKSKGKLLNLKKP